MNEKYFVIEIMNMEDGTAPISITAHDSLANATSAMYQSLASASINDNVKSAYAEVKDIYGNKKDNKLWLKPQPQPVPTVEE